MFSGHVISEEDTGSYAHLIKTNDNGDIIVTWCPEPKEKTLRYWKIEDGRLKLLGSFTPDREVTRLNIKS